MRPVEGMRIVARRDESGMLRDVKKGEVWQVTKIDSDGDVNMILCLHANGESAGQERTYVSGTKFVSTFREVARGEERVLLEHEILEIRTQISALERKLRQKEAYLILSDGFSTDEDEVRGIIDAIRKGEEEGNLALQALGLGHLRAVETPDDE